MHAKLKLARTHTGAYWYTLSAPGTVLDGLPLAPMGDEAMARALQTLARLNEERREWGLPAIWV